MSNHEPETIGILDRRMAKHMDLFRVVLIHAAEKTPLPEILEIFGKEMAIKFLDIFAGVTLVVPSREIITHAARDVDIYVTIKGTETPAELREAHAILADRYDIEPWYVKKLYSATEEKLSKHYAMVRG